MTTTTNVLSLCVQARVPVVVSGPPGAAKTEWIEVLACELGEPVETIILSQLERSDVGGLPLVDQTAGTYHLAPPDWAVRLAAQGHGVLFADDLSAAPPEVQLAFLRVMRARVVAGVELGDVAIVAALNPTTTAAGTWDLTSPLANRAAHITWDLGPAEWCAWAMGAPEAPAPLRLPAGWREGIPAQLAGLAAFVRARPSLWHAEPSTSAERGQAWPSARTWELAARLLAACEAVGLRVGYVPGSEEQDTAPLGAEDLPFACVAACVGAGAALEWLSWRRSLDLPDPEWLLADPESWEVARRDDIVYAVAGAVVQAACARTTAHRYAAAWRVLARIAAANRPDLAASAARALARLPQPKSIKLAGQLAADMRSFLPLLDAVGRIPGGQS